ncbi:antA/AntB antirepressor family protein [Chondrinema litorale]|uniref:antA/AntB antirepressor family protein n=1 Tax=Chondrinema litorale TaxID=2994555 RepID=UPI002542F963|nr:antA/AntB antirepressor family protein [Chondrinema litorale]UZR99606.1 antA/AntB antirepressor family protein [Chondrinema litorale]
MELIKIYNGSLVNARELWEFLEVNTKFSMWINRMIQYGFEEGKEFFPILGKTPEKGGRPKTEYYLTISMAKEIAMLQRNDKGREARRYFIKCEETLQALKQEDKRFETFLKLESTKNRLRENIENIGGTYEDYLQIDLDGRKVLFNGNPIPDDELQIVLLKGRDFATELTNMHLNTEEHSVDNANILNKAHHKEVRETIQNSMKINPENIPTKEKIKKLGE